jgi:hypothetical protein
MKLDESINKYIPENIIRKEAGIKSENWAAFWGLFFIGPVGALLFYFLRKDANAAKEPKVRNLIKLSDSDAECKRVIAEIDKEVASDSPDKAKLKDLKSRLTIRLRVLQQKDLKSKKMSTRVATAEA